MGFLVFFVILALSFIFLNGGIRRRRKPRVWFIGPLSIYGSRVTNKPKLVVKMRGQFGLPFTKRKPVKKGKRKLTVPIPEGVYRWWMT